MDIFELLDIKMPKTTAEWLRKEYSEKQIALAMKEALMIGKPNINYVIAYLEAHCTPRGGS